MGTLHAAPGSVGDIRRRVFRKCFFYLQLLIIGFGFYNLSIVIPVNFAIFII